MKWWQVYTNDQEKRFFVGRNGNSGLVRHPEFDWRSTDKLSEESGLTKEQTEQIIDKYHKAGLVVQNPKDPEKWGYWENVARKRKPNLSVSEEDQRRRLDKADPNSPTPAPAAPKPAPIFKTPVVPPRKIPMRRIGPAPVAPPTATPTPPTKAPVSPHRWTRTHIIQPGDSFIQKMKERLGADIITVSV